MEAQKAQKVEQATHPLMRVIIHTWRCAGLVAHDGIHLTMVGGATVNVPWRECGTGAIQAPLLLVSLWAVLLLQLTKLIIHGMKM